MAKHILNENDFEGLRLFEPTSQIHKVVGQKIRDVMAKLYTGTDINLDEFYFSVQDSKNPNAFFISKDETISDPKKNMIVVSTALINALSCTEEFAAVIAHESGHFLWDVFLGGKNTRFQERASDIKSVDLMMNGGYNPRHILNMQETIFEPARFANTITINVHGAGNIRMKDVEATLSDKANKMGSFKKIPKGYTDPEWDLFKQTVNMLNKTEPYHTFIEKKLYEKFGTYDFTKIPRPDLLAFLYSIAGDITPNSTRKKELDSILSDLKLEKQLTDSETKILQDFYINHDIISVLKYIEPFGPFLELIDYINKFLETDDEKQEQEYAKKIKDLIGKNYAYDFDKLKNHKKYTIFDKPIPTNGTKIPPYDKLDKYNLVSGSRWVGHGNTYVVVSADVAYFKADNYYCNNDGFVIAYGDKAKKLNEERRKRWKLNELKQELDNGFEHINKRIESYKEISDYIDNKISTKAFYKKYNTDELYKILYRLFSTEGFTYLDDEQIKYFNNEIKQNYKNLKNSKFYKKLFLKLDSIFSPYQIIRHAAGAHINKSKGIKDKLLTLAKYAHDNNDHVYEAMILYYTGYSTKQASLNKVLLAENLNKSYDFDGIYKQIFDDQDKNIIENVYKTIGFKNTPKTENELLLVLQQIQQLKFADKYKDLDPNVEKKSIKFPIGTTNKILGKNNKNISFIDLKLGHQTLKTHSMLFFFYDYMKNGYECNPAKIAAMFKGYLTESNYMYASGHYYGKIPNFDIIRETFANYVTKQRFKSLSLTDKMYLYEFFTAANLFSEKNANKNMMIKIIVDEIVNTKDKESVIQYVENILTRNPNTEIDTKHKEKDVEFANERIKLIEFYTDYWAKKIGQDDKSSAVSDKVKSFAEFLTSKDSNGYQRFSDYMRRDISDMLAQKIQSQKETTKILDDTTKFVISGKTPEKYSAAFIAAEEILRTLNHEQSLALINFLNDDVTDESVNAVMKTFDSDYTDNSYINKQSLIMLHENFWAASLPIRAYAMNKILDGYSSDYKDKLDLVLNNFMAPDSTYYNDGKLVLHSVYNNLENYEQSLILAALIAAVKKNNSSNISDGQAVGHGIKMFLQNKGPAFIKFGQLLSYLPSLDPDIRQELSTLRDKADIPTRAKLFEMLETSLPEDVYNKVSYVSKVLGAGSFFVTLQIEYDGKPCVISLMREYTVNRTKTGIDMINNTIKDMAKADKKFEILKNIVNQARDSALSEIDIEQDYKKYVHAKKIYENFKVNTPNATYSPDVANWITYGYSEPRGEKEEDQEPNSYKIMEMAGGKPLTSDEMSEQEKHDMALAYTALELSILLSGEKWDTDRHAGQQNFQEIYNPAFKEFCIGIFDTGAQMKNTPNKKEKIAFGYLLYELVNGIRNGQSLNDILNNKITKLDKIGNKLHLDTLYIDGIQRGLMALSDIIQYQKEVKDEDGNIIQPAKSLTKNDLQNIVTAIINTKLVDKTIINTVKVKAVIDKLLFWRHGLADAMSEKDFEDYGDISIEYKDIGSKQNILSAFKKSSVEIKNLINKRNENKHLGIEKGRTKRVAD